MQADEIAIIDDNRPWVDAVAEALADQGYRVRTASSAEEAMRLLSRHSPRMVILDVQLPGMSGLRLLDDFRHRDGQTPVLMMSSDDRASVHEQAMARGANGFLRKPFPPSLLLSAIRRYLDHSAECLAQS